MSMTVGGESEYNSEINVTPMVDIMLVLLIIFMIVTPLLQKGVPIQLPSNMLSPEEDQYINNEKAVVLSIPTNDQYYIGKDIISKDFIGEKVKKLLEGQTEKRIVYIKCGVNVDYGSVVEAINIIRKQDVDKIGLVADKKKSLQQPGS
jgi:biopolymer transport protein ExbD/biopolymer transport protein TolR